MKTIACIIARTNSTRLPLKVLRDCGAGYSIIELLIKRLKTAGLDQIYLCTSKEPGDDIMEDIANINDIGIYRGSANKVIERMVAVSKITQSDIILRITGDNPLTSIEYIENQVNLLKDKSLDYVRLINVPIGSTAEVIGRDALTHYYENYDPNISEYMMLYLFNPDVYKCGVIKPFRTDFSNYTITVDTNEDLKRLKDTLLFFNNYQEMPEKILLKNIIKYYTYNSEIKNHLIKNKEEIKLPFGEVKSFIDFNKDIKNREQQSILVKLYKD